MHFCSKLQNLAALARELFKFGHAHFILILNFIVTFSLLSRSPILFPTSALISKVFVFSNLTFLILFPISLVLFPSEILQSLSSFRFIHSNDAGGVCDGERLFSQFKKKCLRYFFIFLSFPIIFQCYFSFL